MRTCSQRSLRHAINERPGAHVDVDLWGSRQIAETCGRIQVKLEAIHSIGVGFVYYRSHHRIRLSVASHFLAQMRGLQGAR